jgi:hypothetical protein
MFDVQAFKASSFGTSRLEPQQLQAFEQFLQSDREPR